MITFYHESEAVASHHIANVCVDVKRGSSIAKQARALKPRIDVKYIREKRELRFTSSTFPRVSSARRSDMLARVTYIFPDKSYIRILIVKNGDIKVLVGKK